MRRGPVSWDLFAGPLHRDADIIRYMASTISPTRKGTESGQQSVCHRYLASILLAIEYDLWTRPRKGAYTLKVIWGRQFLF